MFYTNTSIYRITNIDIANNSVILAATSRTNTDKPLGSCNISTYTSTSTSSNYIYNILSNYITESVYLNLSNPNTLQINYSSGTNISTNTDELMNNYTHYATFASPDDT